MKKIIMTFGLVLTTLLSFSQSATVVDIIVNSEDHTLLEAAVVEAGLVDALSDTTGTFTVFAPTDSAFITLATELNLEVEDLLELPNLTDILLYHVLPEVYLGEVLLPPSINSMLITLLPEEPMYIQSDGTTVTIATANGYASVIVTDLIADNGVVHVIDAVLLPVPVVETTTVVDVVVDSEDHTVLELAVVQEELVETLSGEGPFTVFAPTDAAFTALAEAFNVEVTALLELQNLTDILTYHVVSGTVLSTDLTDGMEATALNGGTLTFTVDSMGVEVGTAAVGPAMVIVADIVTDNGVVHVIDAVLVPETPSSISEIELDILMDNVYYNIMGQEIRSYNDIPLNSVYIINGKKFIKVQN
jgi:uncharacterized surface protein with fasciclin (FAS1) repeats